MVKSPWVPHLQQKTKQNLTGAEYRPESDRTFNLFVEYLSMHSWNLIFKL